MINLIVSKQTFMTVLQLSGNHWCQGKSRYHPSDLIMLDAISQRSIDNEEAQELVNSILDWLVTTQLQGGNKSNNSTL